MGSTHRHLTSLRCVGVVSVAPVTYAVCVCIVTGAVCSEGEGEDGEDLSKMVEAEEDSALHMLVSGKNFDEVVITHCTLLGVEVALTPFMSTAQKCIWHCYFLILTVTLTVTNPPSHLTSPLVSPFPPLSPLLSPSPFPSPLTLTPSLPSHLHPSPPLSPSPLSSPLPSPPLSPSPFTLPFHPHLSPLTLTPPPS